MQGNAALSDMIGLGLQLFTIVSEKKKASPAPCSSLVRECAGDSELVRSSANGVRCRGRGKRIVVAIQSKQLRVDIKRFICGRRRRRPSSGLRRGTASTRSGCFVKSDRGSLRWSVSDVACRDLIKSQESRIRCLG
jgi:hypothetical protein